MTAQHDLLYRTLAPLQVELSHDICTTLVSYAQSVVDANARVNLTGAKTVDDFIEGPLFDALTLLPVLVPEGSLVDIGSGGGLPGIPVAIAYPDLTITLVEPRKKRADFLQEITALLHLTPDVRQTQDREFPADSFDGAVAQAVFPPKKWMARAKRLVRGDGAVYVLSSADVTDPMLPPNVAVESRKVFQRPMDKTDRFAFRLRVHKNP